MAQYLVLLRKQDFADLFKYGIIHANRDSIIEFVGDVKDVSENYMYFDSLTAFANTFDSTFTYMVLHYEKTSTKSRVADIEIEDVQHIFPLDKEAKILLEEDFGPTIKFSEPLWSNGVARLRMKQALENSQKGLSDIIRVFALEENYIEECRALFCDSVIKEVLYEVFNEKRPEGDLPLWVYLLRYERHSMYPKTTLGFCMDAVHAITNYSQKKEFTSIEGAGIFQFLDSLDYSLTMNKIMDKLSNANEAERFLAYLKSVDPENNILLIASIFFFLKDKFEDGLYYEEDFVNGCKKAWPFEFTAACYLLGWVLGHTRSFECLYEQISLKILRKKAIHETIPYKEETPSCSEIENVKEDSTITEVITPMTPPEEKVAEEMSSKGLHKTGEQLEMFQDETSLPSLRVKMGKLKKKPKHDKDVSKKPAPQIVTSKAEMEKLLKEGWVIID